MDPDDILVLMACSATKTNAARGRVLLFDLYQGPIWLTLKTHLGVIPRRNVFVLSAKLGFRRADFCQSEPYEARLGPAQAARLIERGARAPNDRLGAIKPGRMTAASAIGEAWRGKPYRAVICAASGLYRAVFEAWLPTFTAERVIAPGAAVLQTAGGIGEQRAQLRAYLATHQAAPIASTAAPPRPRLARGDELQLNLFAEA